MHPMTRPADWTAAGAGILIGLAVMLLVLALGGCTPPTVQRHHVVCTAALVDGQLVADSCTETP